MSSDKYVQSLDNFLIDLIFIGQENKDYNTLKWHILPKIEKLVVLYIKEFGDSCVAQAVHAETQQEIIKRDREISKLRMEIEALAEKRANKLLKDLFQRAIDGDVF